MPRSITALLGGGGLGPWAWDRVTAVLNARGIETSALQLRGTGNDPTLPNTLSLLDWIDDLALALRNLGPANITLVAHSFSGYVAAGLLERSPSMLTSVTFLDAVLPEPGRSRFETLGADAEQAMRKLSINDAIPFFTRDQLDALHPNHGITDPDWEWMQPQLSPVPVAMFAETPTTRPLDPARTPLAYVRCLGTNPAMAEIDASSPGWKFRTLDTGHWPMISNPVALADIIAELLM
jgi:pimeloyl-ACP methyl ester carboxylesterase